MGRVKAGAPSTLLVAVQEAGILLEEDPSDNAGDFSHPPSILTPQILTQHSESYHHFIAYFASHIRPPPLPPTHSKRTKVREELGRWGLEGWVSPIHTQERLVPKSKFKGKQRET